MDKWHSLSGFVSVATNLGTGMLKMATTRLFYATVCKSQACLKSFKSPLRQSLRTKAPVATYKGVKVKLVVLGRPSVGERTHSAWSEALLGSQTFENTVQPWTTYPVVLPPSTWELSKASWTGPPFAECPADSNGLPAALLNEAGSSLSHSFHEDHAQLPLTHYSTVLSREPFMTHALEERRRSWPRYKHHRLSKFGGWGYTRGHIITKTG